MIEPSKNLLSGTVIATNSGAVWIPAGHIEFSSIEEATDHVHQLSLERFPSFHNQNCYYCMKNELNNKSEKK